MRNTYEWTKSFDVEIDFNEILNELKELDFNDFEEEDDFVHEAIRNFIAGYDDDIYYTMPYMIRHQIETDFYEWLKSNEYYNYLHEHF